MVFISFFNDIKWDALQWLTDEACDWWPAMCRHHSIVSQLLLLGFLLQMTLHRDWTFSPECPLAGEIRIAFVLYKHIGMYLSTENASMKLGSEAIATNYSLIVNSPIITAAINKDSNKVYLSDPVIFTIRHLQVSFFFVCPYVRCMFLLSCHCCHFNHEMQTKVSNSWSSQNVYVKKFYSKTGVKV